MPTPFRSPESEPATNGSAPVASSGGRPAPPAAPPLTSKTEIADDRTFDLKRRRDQLNAKVAELQWDLGGLVYEMATRNDIRVDVITLRAAALQEADAELAEIERIVRLEETGMAGVCPNCGSPHSTGASFCWQCGQPLLAQSGDASA
jgi:hypothetical protein